MGLSGVMDCFGLTAEAAAKLGGKGNNPLIITNSIKEAVCKQLSSNPHTEGTGQQGGLRLDS